MPFTDTEQVVSNNGNSYNDPGVVLDININDPFLQQDLGVIIQGFEVSVQNWEEDDYTKVYLYRDVYNTENFSQRVQDQMNYYPGMHQTASAPSQEDPLYTNAKGMADDRLNFWNNAMDNPSAFASGLESRQGSFDYTKIFGADTSLEDRAKNIGKMITECVPCFDRLLDIDGLLPNGDLLEIHALNIKIRTDILDKIRDLFKDPGFYIDICSLLKMLSHLCPQDLLAIVALLTQFLAKLNLDIKFNLDFIIELVGPILSPFLDALSQWLDKWIQLILEPIICVLDHINETILIAQSMKIPFSEVGFNVGVDTGMAGPLHNNAAGSYNLGGSAGLGDAERSAFDQGPGGAHAGVWGSQESEYFKTPDEAKYNPNKPTYPAEEAEMAWEEVKESWSPSFTDAEREERNARWAELRQEHYNEQYTPPPPLTSSNYDGTRWSKDDIPESEKYGSHNSFEAGYNPPESQENVKPGREYFVTSPIVDSIIQVRDIMQGAIQYVKDWFEYITQMIYDLLGTDFGWMSKKTDNTIIKSRIIQLIMMIKSIVTAVSKNGLECGTHSNFNPEQLKFILEDGLNKFSMQKFKVADDGTITMSTGLPPNVKDLSKAAADALDKKQATGHEVPEGVIEQKSSESGIIIKDCFKRVSKEELDRAKLWIADFERRGDV